MSIRLAAAVVTLLCVSAQAQTVDAPKSEPGQKSAAPREVPKPSSPMDRFDVKTTDTGRNLQRRLELDVPTSKDTFIFGDKTTTYPMGRDPGTIYQPPVPQQTPQDRYSIGIGRRF
jgi:hypothetical protein